MTRSVSRLALGTVQFGLPYGVANSSGRVSKSAAGRMLQVARGAGMDTLDTAVAYGESERLLGELGVAGWRVVSKLPPLPDGEKSVAGWVDHVMRESLNRLGVPNLHAVLLHRPTDLLGSRGDRLYDALVSLKTSGRATSFGVSVYSPDEIEVLASRFKFDVVQAPFNVFDRRLETSGWLRRLKDLGVEVHTRSVFLQGLLLMTPGTRPIHFNRWQPLWQRWDEWLAETGANPVHACLAFALERHDIDRVLVGFDTLSQLEEALAALDTVAALPPGDLYSDDAELLNPSRWPART